MIWWGVLNQIRVENVQLVALDNSVTYQKILRCSVLTNEIWAE
jgi:hypothetical protein